MELDKLALVIISTTYVIVWSVSFYFQLGLIIKLKSSEGYSFDYQIFNLFGFSYYTLSNIHYMQKNQWSYDSVMDMVFAAHALLISIVIFGLTFYYPRKTNKGHYGPYIMIFILGLFALIYDIINKSYLDGEVGDLWIFMGMGKSIVSTLKYMYQIFLNKDKKSTLGFSIGNVILDITGGVLSLLGEILKVHMDKGSYLDNKTNVPKIALSLVVIVFDVVLILQHYVIYRPKFK